MVLKALRPPSSRPAARIVPVDLRGECEVTVYCPGCTAFETVWFLNGRLMETRKFTVRGGTLYHDCGTARPCRLYRPK